MGFFGFPQQLETLQLPDVYLHEVQARYCRRRDFLIQGLVQLGWDIPKTKNTITLIPLQLGSDQRILPFRCCSKLGWFVLPEMQGCR